MPGLAATEVIGQEAGRLNNDSRNDGASILLGIRFDRLTADTVLARLAARPPETAFAYVVTINVDHFLRLDQAGPELCGLYQRAWISVCDSRVLRLMAQRRGHMLDVVTGSDLTLALFSAVIDGPTPITIIGGDDATIARLRERFGLQRLAHHNPPMGFIQDAAAVADCVDYVHAHPARFVFLCVGSPQQEILAARIAESGRASGVGLCVGAAIEFAAGTRQRAPVWMQQAHLEWLHRLAQEPGRLWRRYLLGALPLLAMMRRVERAIPDAP
jgi:N-acetylglucosaminyldiphosphoundecaprenol N-acetyl-beta-D-mannosaminyltransferase